MTTTNYNKIAHDYNPDKMKAILHRYEITIDTILSLQGFKHTDNNGWLNDASIVNDWTESVIELIEELDDNGLKSYDEMSLAITQHKILCDYARIDILKDLLKTW